jgi:hypothetical protein
MSPDYDVIVIGSGFGGSVTALRLSEKGYRVGVLEQGARWRPEDYPSDGVPMRKTMWQPSFGFFGPLQLTVLKNVTIQSAVGVGGGSLIYGRPQRSMATLTAGTLTSSTARALRISSAVAPSEIHPPPASSIRISGCTGTPVCTSSMDRRSRPTWASTPPSPSPRYQNGRSRSGPTRANPTCVLPSVPDIRGFCRCGRAIPSCPKAHPGRFDYQRFNPPAARIPAAHRMSRRGASCCGYPARVRWG